VTCAILFLINSLVNIATAQKPKAALPKVLINTTWNLPAGGTTWAAHTSAQLTGALNKAQPGDIIKLDAGTVYTGNWNAPAKSNPNHKWIYVTSTAYNRLPAPGTRVSPADAVNMPKLVTPGSTRVMGFPDGSNYWRFVGIEIYSNSSYHPSGYTPGVNFSYQLVDKHDYPGTKNLPDHIFFDRCYIHGDDTHDLQHGVVGNFTYFAIFDSWVSDIHAKVFDTQAVLAWETPGPIKVVNNYLSAATENMMLGGAQEIFGFIPSDVEVRNNYFFKPLAWVDKSVGTNTYVVKNLFECKDCQRVLLDHNTLENNWVSGQVGDAVVITPRNAYAVGACAASDITVTNNVLKNVVKGFRIGAADGSCGTSMNPTCTNACVSHNWDISNNLVLIGDRTQKGFTGGQTGLAELYGQPDRLNQTWVPITDLILQHNTAVPFGSDTSYFGIYFVADGFPAPPWNPPYLTDNVWILDNVLPRQVFSGHCPEGTAAEANCLYYPPTPYDYTQRFYGNVMWKEQDAVHTWTTGNDVSSTPITYVNPPIDYTLSSPRWTTTSDGKLAGVDVSQLP